MELLIADDYAQMSLLAARLIAQLIRTRPESVLGLTTGNTPVGLYEQLVEWQQAGTFSLHAARIFCTEEYLGVGPTDPRSLFAWLSRMLITPCALPDAHIFRLRGEDAEPQLACLEFEDQLRQCGGFDMVVESIGINGHIGFNEPGSPVHAPTRILALSNDTLEYNASYWDLPVPAYGLTIGLSTLLQAKHILLLVSGQAKAEPLAKALSGPITSDVPASFLQYATRLTVIADKAAAALLSEEQRVR